MIWLILLATLADITTTRTLLNRGGRELNPVSLYIMGEGGFWLWSALKVIAAVMVWHLSQPLLWPSLVASAGLFGVAAWNLRELRKL